MARDEVGETKSRSGGMWMAFRILNLILRTRLLIGLGGGEINRKVI